MNVSILYSPRLQPNVMKAKTKCVVFTHEVHHFSNKCFHVSFTFICVVSYSRLQRILGFFLKFLCRVVQSVRPCACTSPLLLNPIFDAFHMCTRNRMPFTQVQSELSLDWLEMRYVWRKKNLVCRQQVLNNILGCGSSSLSIENFVQSYFVYDSCMWLLPASSTLMYVSYLSANRIKALLGQWQAMIRQVRDAVRFLISTTT